MKTNSIVRMLAGWLICCVVAGAAESERPNLIIINIDDLGYGEISPFGGRIATPELDRMATEGRKLTSHYAAPVCSPSRAALMTGCYPKRVLPVPHVLFPAGAVGLTTEARTLAEVLRAGGYATAMIGKWHLGDQAPFLPTRRGFERYYGLPYSNDMGPGGDGVKNDLVVGAAVAKAEGGAKAGKAPAAKAKANPPVDDETGVRGNQPPLALLEGDKVVGRVRIPEQIDLMRRYTERAVAYIREPREKPFFLYLAPNAVHFPRYPRAEYVGRSGQGLLGDWIREMDWSVGEVLAALRATGLDRRTLVIFTSDNGGPVQQGAVNRPLRGSKGTTWEGGMRVPTIAWWPGKVPAGTETGAITSMMDVLPTFAALARVPLAAGERIDGVDLGPLLVGEPVVPPRNTFFYFNGLKLEAIRHGGWKLHLGTGQLYNLVADVGEAQDVAASNPDVVARLRAVAEPMRADLGWEGVGPGCRPLARVAEPKPLIAVDGTVRVDAVRDYARLP
jgi:arylsulfatase A-like enzyme